MFSRKSRRSKSYHFSISLFMQILQMIMFGFCTNPDETRQLQIRCFSDAFHKNVFRYGTHGCVRRVSCESMYGLCLGLAGYDCTGSVLVNAVIFR